VGGFLKRVRLDFSFAETRFARFQAA